MMKDYQGYNNSTDYEFYYFNNWTLSKIELACVKRGIETPKITNACELGYGQGVTLNIQSTTTDVNWYGTDINQNHSDFTSSISHKVNNSAKIYNLSFDEFIKAKNLPKFDLIALHGIFSWVNESNQNILLEFIQKYLNTGGIVYISYNTKPGADNLEPAQHLMQQINKLLLKDIENPNERIDKIFNLLDELNSTNPLYLNNYPTLKSKLDSAKKKNANYLTHEYLNESWQSFYFSQMADKLVQCDLLYLGQSKYSDGMVDINYTNEQIKFFNKFPSPLKEDMQDTIISNSFRKDFWINSPKKLTKEKLDLFLKNTKVILLTIRSQVNLETHSKVKKIKLNDEFYTPLLNLLSDYKPRSLEEIQNTLKLTPDVLLEIVTLLNDIAALNIVNESKNIKEIMKRTRKYNEIVLDGIFKDFNLTNLASAVASDAITITEKLILVFIKGYIEKNRIQKSLLNYCVATYVKHGWAIKSNNQLLKSEKELTKIFTTEVKHFLKEYVPFLKAHKIL